MPGTLSIRPLSAKLTRNTELFGTMDPYCKFQLGKQNVSGQVCKNGGKHPVWDETLVLKRVNEPMCHLELKEHDWLLPDGLIGECNINLNEVENKQRVLKWYNLSYTGKPVGQILLEINYDAEKGNNYLAPVDKATTGQRVEPEYRGYIPSGNEVAGNQLNQQFPGLTEVQNLNNNYQQGFQPQNNQFVGNNDYLHQQQQYNPYDNNYIPQQQDMFAPPAHENYGSYLPEGQKYPSFENPSYENFYSNDQQSINQGRPNQQHEVIDYRNNQPQTGFNANNAQQKYPGVTNQPLTPTHQRDQEKENAGWDPVRLIRGVMGTKK